MSNFQSNVQSQLSMVFGLVLTDSDGKKKHISDKFTLQFPKQSATMKRNPIHPDSDVPFRRFRLWGNL